MPQYVVHRMPHEQAMGGAEDAAQYDQVRLRLPGDAEDLRRGVRSRAHQGLHPNAERLGQRHHPGRHFPRELLRISLLPGQPDRTIVRYRIRANRGESDEVVSPRADDPYLWHAYFVTPNRAASNPSYDVFVSAASLFRRDKLVRTSSR